MTTARTMPVAALVIATLVVPVIQQGQPQSVADRFSMNQNQVLGSHNSYKKAIDPALSELLRKRDPRGYSAIEYSHVPFAEQLDMGMRKLEIDVVYDPQGGLYARPLGLRLMKEGGATNIPAYDPDAVMMKPG